MKDCRCIRLIILVMVKPVNKKSEKLILNMEVRSVPAKRMWKENKSKII